MSFRRIVLLTVILMDLLSGMEFDLFVPSFPELQHQFALSPSWVEALLSVNFIGYCLSLFFVGALADRYGRKPIILLGLMTFVCGSVFCLWPASYAWLLAGRFLQGVGIAAPAILSFLIIADAYPLQRQKFLMGILNGIMNIAVAVAPVLGSYITLYFHWQGNFIALLFLGVLVLLLTARYIPAHKPVAPQEKVSHIGYLKLFQLKPLMLLVTQIVFMCIPYWIFVGMSPLLYMKNLGVSLSHFGYYQGIFALVFGFGSIFVGLIVNRCNQKNMLYVANGIFIISFISLTTVTLLNSSNALLITLAFLPFVIGQIIPITILYPVCLNLIPAAKGRVSAILQGSRLLFTALALQLAGYSYQGTFQHIGLIIMGFIVIVIITLFLVMKNRELQIFFYLTYARSK